MRHEQNRGQSQSFRAAEDKIKRGDWRPAILVVDDDRDIEKQVRHIIKGCLPQADCFWVKSGSEARGLNKRPLKIR